MVRCWDKDTATQGCHCVFCKMMRGEPIVIGKMVPLSAFRGAIEVGDVVRDGWDGYWSTHNEKGPQAKVYAIDRQTRLVELRKHFDD